MLKRVHSYETTIDRTIPGTVDMVQRVIRSCGFAILVVGISVLMSTASKAQSNQDCDLNFEYEVRDTSGSGEDGAIFISRTEGTGPFTIRLYDLLAAKQEFEDTRQFDSMSTDKKIKVFDNVARGTYLIRVENAHCSRSLSGIQGIVVK